MPIPDIKIPLCLLAFGGYGSLDLGEILQLRPRKGCSFEFGPCTFALSRRNDPWEKHPLAHMDFGGQLLLLFIAKAHTWLWDGGSLDLVEIWQFRPWKGCTFEFSPYTFTLSYSSDPRGKHLLAHRRNGLTWAPFFSALYCASLHLALGRQIARSRQDLPILDRLLLRFLPRHVCTFTQQ